MSQLNFASLPSITIAIAQLNYTVGAIEHNTRKIIDTIQQAKRQQVDLIVFSELAICGYPPKDLLAFDDFIARCEQGLTSISKACKDIACIVGTPLKNNAPVGKNLANGAVFIANGAIQHLVQKSLLPTYDVFDEHRYFEPSQTLACIPFRGIKIALTICEDLWRVGPKAIHYQGNPMEVLIKETPQLLINIAASPFSYQQAEERMAVLKSNVQRYQTPLIYVNQVGANTDLVFDGGSLAIDSDGSLLANLSYFEEQIHVIRGGQPAPIVVYEPIEAIANIHQALLLGIRDYFNKLSFNKAVLGLSGGIDSAVVCALACEALGADRVHAVLMPSRFSSEHSLNDALNLIENLGCTHQLMPIEEPIAAFDNTLSGLFPDLPVGIVAENIQARVRAILLMALSNNFGWVLLNTSNKSELAVGYGTLYGDMCGALAVIGDLYKTQVYDLARYLNRKQIVIPVHSITKAPSAELRPNQKDSDSLPDYALLDAILFDYVEQHLSTKQLLAKGFTKEVVEKVVQLVNLAEYKRHQAPPVIRISPKAFGAGRCMPIVAQLF